MNVKGYYKEKFDYDWFKARKSGKLSEKLYHEARLRAFINKVDFQGRLVLDIGCNTGVFSFDIASKGAKVVAFDISRKVIMKGAERAKGNKNVLFMLADAESMPFKKDVFDIAIVTGTLEHVERPENVVKGIEYSLRKGGKVVVDVPHKFSVYNVELFRRILSSRSDLALEPFHNYFSKEQLISLFEGFKLLKIYYACFFQELFAIFEK